MGAVPSRWKYLRAAAQGAGGRAGAGLKKNSESDKLKPVRGPARGMCPDLNTYKAAVRIAIRAAGAGIMREKVITGLALSFGMLIVLIYAGWLLFAVIMLGAAMAMWEYYQMLRKKNLKPMVWLGMAAGLGFIAMAFAGKWYPPLSHGSANIGAVVTVYVFIILLIQFFQIVQKKVRYRMADLGVTVFGSLYIGAFGSFIFLIANLTAMQFPDSPVQQRLVLFMTMWAAWGNDVGAYFVGKFFGKNRIFPELSPKKTLEGCLGGLATSMIGMCILALFVQIPMGHGFLLGLVAGAAGQVGDLSESALKREVEIKDSGTIFGSHGGLLDRIDSFLFTVPVIYHYLIWVNPWGL